MKADRLFYSAAAIVFLLVMLVGFHPFYTHGTHFDGSPIDRGIFLLVLPPETFSRMMHLMRYREHCSFYLAPAFLLGLYLTWAGFGMSLTRNH